MAFEIDYTAADATNPTNNNDLAYKKLFDGIWVPVSVTFAAGSFSFTVNETDSTVSGSTGRVQIGFELPGNTLEFAFDLDYSDIPSDARISKLVWNLPSSINWSGSGTPSSSASQPSIFYPHFLTSTVSSRVNSVSGTDADVVIFEHTDPDDYITRAELIASYTTFELSYDSGGPNYIGATANGEGGPPTTGTAILTCSIGDGWTVTVTYELTFQWQWTIPQPAADTPVNVGSTITLTSPEDVEEPVEAIDFEEVTQIDILIPDYDNPGTFITVNVPEISWTLIQAHLLTFTMPSWGGLFPTVVYVQLTSTQFSGTVSQQLYTIYFVSASGIYELVPGKTSDTLYIEAEPGETIDVKIPDPYAKTGFFGK